MALFGLSASTSPRLVLEAEGIHMRAPDARDMAQWLELREQSRDFLQRWEPPWPHDDVTRRGFKRRLAKHASEIRLGVSRPFFLFDSRNSQLVGGVNLSNIRRGAAQMASMGYWMGAPYAGKGYMKRAVPLVLDYAFDELGMNRVEASCIPTNTVSLALLRKLGFEEEGYARNYLYIDGKWQDHVLLAKIAGEHAPLAKVPPQNRLSGVQTSDTLSSG
ncbi:GNAT family N-acetyltransferase [Polycladidibacter hongkongensis]|uniref:GNAT family N-acetyltransferase n=1 Tax=Polycladidibacter hongkongensis TaxID=1647556 RepID=UPI0008362DB7|nr:GNAT family protein [Pseudovibrio hongkongensis]